MSMRALARVALLLCFIGLVGGPRVYAQSPTGAELGALYNRAAAYFRAKDYARALSSCEEWAQAIEKAEAAKGKARDRTAEALGHVAWYALFAKQPQKALKAAERALKLMPGKLWLETNRAHALLFLGRPSEAIEAYIDHKGWFDRDRGAWEDLILKDFTEFRARGLNSSIFNAVEKALADPADGPTASNEAALSLLRERKYSEARPLFEYYVAAMKARHGENAPEYATALNNLALLFQATNRLAEAEPLLRRALAIDEKSLGPDDSGVATDLNNLAALLQDTNRLAEAEPLCRRALAIDEKSLGPDHPDVARALNILAELLRDTNRLAEAEPLLRRALTIWEKSLGPDHPDVAKALNNLALLLEHRNRLAEAEPLYRRALAIDEKNFGPDHPDVAKQLNNLAVLLQDTNRRPEAEPLFRRALAIAEKSYGPDHPNTANILDGLAVLLQDTNRLAEAERFYRRALAIREKSFGPDHPGVALALNQLARLLEIRGDWAGAAPLLQRAKKAMITGGVGVGGSGELTKAVLTQNTWKLRAFVRTLHRAAQENPSYLEEGFELAQWALQNEAAEALSSMAARFTQGGGDLAKLVREEQDLQRNRLITLRELDAAAGKADASAAEAARAAIAAAEKKLEDVKAALRQKFPDYADLAAPKPLTLTDARALLGEGQALILYLDVRQFGSLPEETLVFALTNKDARWQSLPFGTRALKERVTALRCGLDSSSWRLGEESRGDCKRLLGTEATEEELPPFDATAAHSLYRSLFDGIEDLVKDKSLLVVPSGALTQMPFEALIVQAPAENLPRFEAYKAASWLGQRHAITVLPSVASLKALAAAKGSTARDPFLGFGNPLLDGVSGVDRRAWAKQSCERPAARQKMRVASYGAGLSSILRGGEVNVEELRHQPPLPETTDELCDAAKTLGVPDAELNRAVYLGERATVSQVKALSKSGDLAQARVVHFATHGLLAGETAFFAKNKAEPALLFTPPAQASADDNGLLTASEAAQLDLNADWVVMSACNTAAGSREGAEALSGLARAFFYAGARSLLVSHWEVDSDAAVAITTGAMNAMKAEPKAGRAEALRRSISALIAKGGRYAHPSMWAPFVLVGNGAL